jgi:hypothetical protein
MSSRADCCTIKKLEGEIAALEADNAALKGQIVVLEEDLAECGETVETLQPTDPALLGYAFGVPGPSGTITDPIDTTGADFLVASVITNIPDRMMDMIGNGNGWFLVGTSGSAPSLIHEMWICRAPQTSVLHNFRYGETITPNATLAVLAFSWGVPPDDPLYIGNALDAASSLPLGPLASPAGKVMFITGLGTRGCNPLGVNDGFKTVVQAPTDVVFGSHGAGVAYKLVDGPATANPIWALDFVGQSAGALLAFNAVLAFPPPALETTAWEHWIPQDGPASLTGLIGGKPLTPVTPPAWSAKAVICPADAPGYLNGLDTHFPEAFSATICVVIKRPPFDGETYITGNGNVLDAAVTALMVRDIAPYDLTIFGKTFASPGGATALAPWAEAGIAVGEWCFVAFQSDADMPKGWIGPASSGHGINSPKLPNSRPVMIGNGYHHSPEAAKKLEVAEVIIFDTTLPFSELTSVFQRSKLRMAEKGITIAGSLII